MIAPLLPNKPRGLPITLKLKPGQRMTVAAPQTCLRPSAMEMCCLPNAAMTATRLYRYRNMVERFFNKLKHFRAIATRFEQHAVTYLALVKLAASKIWMRFMRR